MTNLLNSPQTNIPRIGVGAIVGRINDKTGFEVLLGLRLNKEGHGDHEWAFPGGKLDWMETIKQCAVRETLEEAGIPVVPISEIGFTNDFWPAPINKHFLTVYVSCAVHPGGFQPRVMEPDKCAEWRWWPIGAMPKNLMLGATEILQRHFDLDFKQVS